LAITYFDSAVKGLTAETRRARRFSTQGSPRSQGHSRGAALRAAHHRRTRSHKRLGASSFAFVNSGPTPREWPVSEVHKKQSLRSQRLETTRRTFRPSRSSWPSWFRLQTRVRTAPAEVRCARCPSSRGTEPGTCDRRCRQAGSRGGCSGHAGSGRPGGSCGIRFRRSPGSAPA
jgi:hypothetical protein